MKTAPLLDAPLAAAALGADDPVAEDVRVRAARLGDPFAAPAEDTPWEGDHVLNPDWGLFEGDFRPAAVLFLLMADENGVPSVLFTERAAHLSAHAGQIALPGGKIEPRERPVDAALREAHEEVGVPADHVRPLAVTEPYASRTGFLITPVIAQLTRATPLALDPSEVASAFTAPFSHVMDERQRREIAHTVKGRSRRTFEINYGQRRIWGVTAGILRLVQQRLYAS